MEMPPLSDSHYLAFGRFVVAHARLEQLLHFIIAGLCNIDLITSGVLTTDMSTRQRFDIARALIQFRSSESLEASIRYKLLSELVEKGMSYGRLRNFIVHWPWKRGRSRGEIKPVWASAKGKLKTIGQRHNEKNWTAVEISEKAMEIHDLCDAIAHELDGLGILKRDS
jgi:hypothetical protein